LSIFDTSIPDEIVLGDLNNLINLGEVPNLFDSSVGVKIPDLLPFMKGDYKKEDIYNKILESERARGNKSIPENNKLWQTFIDNVRKNLHVFLVHDANEMFAKRMRV